MTEPIADHQGTDAHEDPTRPPSWARPTPDPLTPQTVPPVDGADPGAVAELRAQVGELVRELTGPVSRVAVQSGRARIEIEWSLAQAGGGDDRAPDPGVRTGTDATRDPAAASAQPDADGPDLHRVTAPLIGTFYVAAEPGADPFVRPGDAVQAGQTVGIIEAMKIMNHIITEHAGQVVEVVAANGEAVEFGQELVCIALMQQPKEADPVTSEPAGGTPPAGDGTDVPAGAESPAATARSNHSRQN